MGIRFLCPNGHKLNVKAFLAGRRGICPFCGAKFQIPTASTLQTGPSSPMDESPVVGDAPTEPFANRTFEQNLESHVQQAGLPASASSPQLSAAWSPQRTSPTEEPAPSAMSPEQAPLPDATETLDREAALSPSAVVSDSSDSGKKQAATAALPQPPTHADPLAEMPNAVWYVRPPSGGQFGPAQADMMRSWLNEGRVSAETLVWQEGWADWQEAGSVFPELQPASAMPGAPPVAVSSTGDATPYRTGPRHRKSGPNMGLIVVLVAAVLLLLLVLVWILAGGTKDQSSDRGSSLAALVASCPPASAPG